MTNIPKNYLLTDDQIAAYRDNGTVCLKGVFNEQEVEALQTAVEDALANPGPHAAKFSGEGESEFVADLFLWTRHPVIRDIVVYSCLGEAAGKLMGVNQTRFFFDHLFVKEPGASKPTPWHQDAPYFAMDGIDCCGIWIALDHVTIENGAVEYLKGTHKNDTLYAQTRFSGQDWDTPEYLKEIPDVDNRRDEFDIIAYDLAPGDCAVHHVRLLHGARGNSSSTTRRRGLATRWIGDDIVYATRDGIPENMTNSLRDLAPDLEIGKPFDGPTFPVIWQRDT